MRRRTIPIPPPVQPVPCGHPLITVAGKTTYACLWGASEEFAVPLDAPEFEAMQAAAAEHADWTFVDGRFTRRVNPELLGPDGKPWRCLDAST